MTSNNDDTKNSDDGVEPDWEFWSNIDTPSGDYEFDPTNIPDSVHTLPKSVLDDTDYVREGSDEEGQSIYDLEYVEEVEGTVEVEMGLTMRSAKELVNSRFEIPKNVPTFVIDVEEIDDGSVLLECFPIRETVRLASGELRTAEEVREQLQ